MREFQSTTSQATGAFRVLMATSREVSRSSHWPPAFSRMNKKSCLKDDFLAFLKERNFGWSQVQLSSHGLPFINIVCEALWTVNGHHAVLNSRSCAVPSMLSKFQGYNCPEQHRHVKASLNSLILDSLSKQLLSTSQQLWMQQSDVKEFGCSLRKYSQYLEQKKGVKK